MVMNKGLQTHIIKQKFEKQGDLDVDLKSLIDESLSLPENVDNLQQKGILRERKEEFSMAQVKNRRVNAQINQAIEALQEKHDRSQKSNQTDSGITAEKTFKPPLTEMEFQEWLDNPSEYDIEGVDTAEDIIKMEIKP